MQLEHPGKSVALEYLETGPGTSVIGSFCVVLISTKAREDFSEGLPEGRGLAIPLTHDDSVSLCEDVMETVVKTTSHRVAKCQLSQKPQCSVCY